MERSALERRTVDVASFAARSVRGAAPRGRGDGTWTRPGAPIVEPSPVIALELLARPPARRARPRRAPGELRLTLAMLGWAAFFALAAYLS